MQILISSGIVADENADYRTTMPVNMIPVPKASGISAGYLRPADGLVQFGTGPGTFRGGINWKGSAYAVMGSKLVQIGSGGYVTELGDVGAGGWVTMDYSFDRLAIASANSLYYYKDGALQKVTDPDLGNVIDFVWVDGYFVTTDGEALVQTELSDPTAVDPLKYGSSEADPDPVVRVLKLRNELCAVNRYTIEVFDNIGGTGFAFQRITGAMIPKGAVGTHACVKYADSIAFIGGGRNESPSIYLATSGTARNIATREIETLLQSYTEAQLSTVVLDVRQERSHSFLLVHLPDQCLVFDATATSELSTPVWHVLSSATAGKSRYLARGFFYCYDRWIAGDPTSSRLCTLSQAVSTHYGSVIGWEFGTQIAYSAGNDAIILELELVGLPGRVQYGLDPTIWTSYSTDGENWSQERPIRAGKAGDRDKRLCWRNQGRIRNTRVQKFRGTSDAHVSFARLEAAIEPLFVRPKP